jgi:hypothetical protein
MGTCHEKLSSRTVVVFLAGARWFVVPVVMALGLSACSVSYTEKTLRSCSPSYSVSHPDGGTISVQQAGRGSVVQWGLFTIPKYKIGSRFDVEIFLGGGKKNVDAFHNTYAEPVIMPMSWRIRFWPAGLGSLRSA